MIASCLAHAPIRRVLAGKSILLTGATSFIAKVLLEKILRTIPEVGTIYLLVPAQDAEQTAASAEFAIFSSSIFNLLRDSGGFQHLVDSKIRFVAGDASSQRLGLNAKDYLLLTNQLDLVINAEPTAEFSSRRRAQALKASALSAKYLSAFVAEAMRARLLHISTCYVNEGIEGRVEEKLYPQPKASRRLPIDAEGHPHLERILASLDRDVDRCARAFGWNGIHTFSNWLGENFIAQAAGKIHATVVRPSLVESCLEAPHEGWIEGWRAADPLLYAAVVDQLPYFPADPQTVVDFMPVDLVCNSVLALLPELMARKNHELKIFHSCNGVEENRITVGELNQAVQKRYRSEKKARTVVFLTRQAWTMARTALKTFSLFAPWMPNGGRFHRKITHALQMSESYSPYMYLRSTFANDSMLAAHAQLAFEDRERYPVTFGSTTAVEYLLDVHVPGLFKNVLQRPLPGSVRPAPVRLRRVP